MRLLSALLLTALTALAQTNAYKAPRDGYGHPNLNGIWQSMNTANWDIQGHAAGPGTMPSLGAIVAEPPGLGIVEGGEIPYLPIALEQREKNFAGRAKLDPEAKCYMPGVPRANYMPYPFQITASKDVILFTYEYAGAVRTIDMKKASEAPTDSWMGWSAGRWEGDTLVIDVTGLNDQSWLDRAGNFHSDALHVVERYTPRSADTMLYEATIEDKNVYSKPWKISYPLYRHVEKNAQLLEFKCVEFAEELMYGDLRKQPSK